MAVDAAVIQTGGDAGGGAGGLLHNWRVLAIGGGILAALVVVLIQRSKAGQSTDANSQQSGTLGTSANIALGQIAFDQTRLSGEQSIRDAHLLDALTGGVSSILAGQQASQGQILGGLASLSQASLSGTNDLKALLNSLAASQGAGFQQTWAGILGLSQEGLNLSAQQQAQVNSLSWQILAAYNPAAAEEWLKKYQGVGTTQSGATGAASGTGQIAAPAPATITSNTAGG